MTVCGVIEKNACSKWLLLDVLAENTLHGICKTLDETTCQIRIKLVRIKDVIREQARVFSPDEYIKETEGLMNEATGMRMLCAVFKSNDESVEQRIGAVHSKKSKDSAIETETTGFAKGKGYVVSIQQAGSRTVVKAISKVYSSAEDSIVADKLSIPPVLKSRSGRNIKRKLHHDERESHQNEKIEDKVKKSKKKYNRGKKQNCKVFVNLGELSEDVDLNPKVLLKRIDGSDTKKSSTVQMTRSGRKIRKKAWWDEMDEVPTSESESELAHDQQGGEATSCKPPKGPRVWCAVCSKSFPASLKYKLSQHIRELHPEGAYNCEQCNFSCLSEEELELHTKRRHSTVERIKCPLCDTRFTLNRKYRMNEHLRKKHSDVTLNCDQCRFVCLSSKELDGHIQNRHDGSNTVQCPACGKAFSPRQYKEHARTEHADVSLKCEKCKFMCLSGEELERHIQDRHFATIKCGLCGERFPITKHYGLSEHIKKHHPDQGLKCNQCSYVFLSDHQLQMHIKRSHSQATSQSKRTKMVKCTMCDEVFRSQLTLENHLIRQHQQKAKHTCRHCTKGFTSACLLKAHEFSHNTKKPFLCTHCGKSFKTLVSLKGHQRVKHEGHVHKRIYRCTLCDKEFNLKYKLEDHRLKQHQEQMVFKCEKCEKRFESPEILAQHQEGKGEKCAKSICIKCNKLFLSRYDLQKHMRAHASAEATENYLCTVCGKSFRFPAQFKIHLETHAPEPKYECHICDKKTFTRGNLRGHMIVHQTVRKYHCEVCGKGFKTASKLKNHVVIHTGEKNHVCDICGKAFNHNGTLWLHRKDVHKVSRTKPPTKNQNKNDENFIVGTGGILNHSPTRKDEVSAGNGLQLQQKPGAGDEVIIDNMGNILGQEVSTEEIIAETMEYSEFVKDLHDNSN